MPYVVLLPIMLKKDKILSDYAEMVEYQSQQNRKQQFMIQNLATMCDKQAALLKRALSVFGENLDSDDSDWWKRL